MQIKLNQMKTRVLQSRRLENEQRLDSKRDKNKTSKYLYEICLKKINFKFKILIKKLKTINIIILLLFLFKNKSLKKYIIFNFIKLNYIL